MKINFLVADEIRSEVSGKQTVLGLFPDHTIVIENPLVSDTDGSLQSGLIDRLAFLINISDVPAGDHEIYGQIFDPTGNPHGERFDFGTMSIAKGTSKSFVIVANPFLVNGKGSYSFNIYIDGEVHQFPFNIIEKSVSSISDN